MISDAAASSGQQEVGARTYLYKQTQTRELTVTFDKIKGNHDFKFGVDYRQYPDNQISGSNATDLTLSFGTTFTNGPLDNSPASPRGQGMASFLYGIPTSGSLQLPAASNFADTSWLYAPFFQDSWKVTRKLMLTLGVRYEYETAETGATIALRWGSTRPPPCHGPHGCDRTMRRVLRQRFQRQFLPAGGLTFPAANGHGLKLYRADPIT